MGEKPLWRMSSLEREEAKVAAQQRPSREKSTCGSPRDTRHRGADGTTSLGGVPVIDPQPHTPSCLTLKAQDTWPMWLNRRRERLTHINCWECRQVHELNSSVEFIPSIESPYVVQSTVTVLSVISFCVSIRLISPSSCVD